MLRPDGLPNGRPSGAVRLPPAVTASTTGESARPAPLGSENQTSSTNEWYNVYRLKLTSPAVAAS